ncbi:MAG: sugar phosphate isomerase/epimerase [Verrucomicrobia bacterium]|nr:sugar phosphate isomerase/epimerase [Verrucomicrobiota bacterium]
MNRRSFLQLAAASSAAVATHPLLAAAPGKCDLKKGIMWGTVGVKGSVLEKMQAIKAAGYDGVEMMGGMDTQEVVEALKATGLVAGSVCCHTHWAKPLSDPNPEVRKVGLEGLKLSLRDAKAYGAPSVLLVPAVVTDKVSYDDAWKRSTAEIRQAIPLAEELGVTISIENVWNNFLLSPMEAARYVDEFQSPAVKWHFDIGNVVVYGWPEQWVRILGPRIQTLHIKEFSRTKADKEGRWAGFGVEFLKGDNNWPAVMKALREINYSGWAIAEQGGADSPEGLQKLSREMDQIFAS